MRHSSKPLIVAKNVLNTEVEQPNLQCSAGYGFPDGFIVLLWTAKLWTVLLALDASLKWLKEDEILLLERIRS